MNILQFFKSLVTPSLRQDCDGIYQMIDVETLSDVKILINQIKLLPKQENIDKSWIISELEKINDTNLDFIKMSIKIAEMKNKDKV